MANTLSALFELGNVDKKKKTGGSIRSLTAGSADST